jgi:hypothetical protein
MSMEMAVESMEMAVESIEMAPGAIPRPCKVPEQRILSPEFGLRWWQCCGTLSGKTPTHLGFSHRRLYIGGGAMSEGTRGAHTMWWHDQGGRHPMVWPPPGPSSESSLDSISCRGKIGTSGFISSNSLCNFSKTQK